MTALLVLAGIVFVAAGIGLRLLPHLVTGVSLYSVLQFLGLMLVACAWYRRRREFAEYVRGRATGRHLRTILVVLWLLPAVHLADAVIGEVAEGRHYHRVARYLASIRPTDALTLATYLPARSTKSAPLRERILEKLVALDFRHPDVAAALRETIAGDPDPGVRARAVKTLAALLTPRDVLDTLRLLERTEPEARKLLAQALAEHSGEDLGDDLAAWRSWFGETFDGADPEESFRLAVRICHDPGEDRVLKDAALRRIETGEGATVRSLRELAADPDSPVIRSAAARLLGRKGDRGQASYLAGRLLVETDAVAADAQVAALKVLDPPGAELRLYEVAERARPGAGRSAARAAILGGNKIDEEDPTALTVFFFRSRKSPADRRRLFDALVRKAGEGEAARRELRSLAGTESETDATRLRAFLAALGADEAGMTDDDLIALLEKKGGRELKEAVRGVLQKRTGKDAGLDPKAWREALK